MMRLGPLRTSSALLALLALLALASSVWAEEEQLEKTDGASGVVTEEMAGSMKSADDEENRLKEEAKAAMKKNVGKQWDADRAFFGVDAGIASAPLNPNLKCSACEVTAREIFEGYSRRSSEDRYAGTELEYIEVLEKACSRLSKYNLGQENFGSHMKFFTDPGSEFDVQNTEPPEFWSKKDRARYKGALWRLQAQCQEYIGQFEDELIEQVRNRVPELELRKYMCNDKTDVCNEDTLETYRKWYSKHRQNWKKKKLGAKLKEKLHKEVNQPFTLADDDITLDEKERKKRQKKKDREEEKRKKKIKEIKEQNDKAYSDHGLF